MHLRLSFLKLFLPLAVIVSSCGTSDEEKKNDTATAQSSDPKIQKLKLPPGFKAERLYSPGENDQGSWVSMTWDDKGRMIVCDQFGAMYRLRLPAIGDSSKPQVEKLVVGKRAPGDTSQKIGMGYAQGLLYAFNSLYVTVNNDDKDNEQLDKTTGLYRLQDTDGDDEFDKVTLLKSMNGAGEHGPHSIILAPDKKSLYIIAGNHVDLPKMDKYLLPSNWHEDNLFPLIKDPSGHANDRTAPGGWVANIDSLGKTWTLVSAGYRNAFDITFNEAGDFFAYDSDMEYDIGMPWYRPTRLCHVTSGSEYGWRTGNSKWSPSFPDNLPAILNIGQGSPTNLIYASNAKFPEKYRKSLLAFDWSFGIIYAIQLEPQGSSYKATAEEFISGAPLPLTDGLIGADGALYFLTGGRRLESDLYRITYAGDESTDASNTAVTINDANKLRRQMESYHHPDPAAVAAAWPQLKNPDRFIRYAARIAIEHQPVEQWQSKVLQEKEPVTLIQGAVALARQGKPAVKDQLLQLLNSVDYAALDGSKQMDLLRAYELVFSRMGMPEGNARAQTIAKLSPHYPASNNYLNRQMSKLLIRLDAPQSVPKTMELMANAKDDSVDQKTFTQSSDLIFRNPQYGLDIASMLSKTPPAQQTYYAVMLSAADEGWTPELHNQYFKWFANAFTHYKGGQSFVGFVDRARKLALEHVPNDRLAYFNTLSGDTLLNKSGRSLASDAKQPEGPGRRWTMEEAVPATDTLSNADFDNGKAMFTASLCSSCHGMRGEGADIGPDLTQLGTRFSTKDMLEAIIDPSKTISDQYAATIFYLKGGNSVVGRLINQNDQSYFVSQNPFSPDQLREIPKADVTRTKLSDVSIMLPGLINRLNEQELRDLMAYLMAGGNKDHPIYKK